MTHTRGHGLICFPCLASWYWLFWTCRAEGFFNHTCADQHCDWLFLFFYFFAGDSLIWNRELGCYTKAWVLMWMSRASVTVVQVITVKAVPIYSNTFCKSVALILHNINRDCQSRTVPPSWLGRETVYRLTELPSQATWPGVQREVLGFPAQHRPHHKRFTVVASKKWLACLTAPSPPSLFPYPTFRTYSSTLRVKLLEWVLSQCI